MHFCTLIAIWRIDVLLMFNCVLELCFCVVNCLHFLHLHFVTIDCICTWGKAYCLYNCTQWIPIGFLLRSFCCAVTSESRLFRGRLRAVVVITSVFGPHTSCNMCCLHATAYIGCVVGYAQTNAHAAWCWLCLVENDGIRLVEESTCKGCHSG